MANNNQALIKFNEQPEDNDSINLQFRLNGQPIEYTSGETEINKTFIENITTPRVRIGRTTPFGKLTNPIGDFNDDVYVIKAIGNTIAVGGKFTEYIHQGTTYEPQKIIFLDKVTGAPIVSPLTGNLLFEDLFISKDGEVRDIEVREDINRIDIAGEWVQAIGIDTGGNTYGSRNGNLLGLNLTSYTVNGNWITNYDDVFEGIDGKILTLHSASNDEILIGGEFVEVYNSTNNPYLIRLNQDYTLNTTFANNFNSQTFFSATGVNTIEVNNNNVWVGGEFEIQIGNQLNKNIVKLNQSGVRDNNFVCSTNGNINVIKLIDGKLHIGGGFGEVNGTTQFIYAAVGRDTGNLLGIESPFASSGDIYDIEEIINPQFGGATWAVVGDTGGFINGYIFENPFTQTDDTTIVKEIWFNDTIFTVELDREEPVSTREMFFGGGFSLYDTSSAENNDINKVFIQSTAEDTRDRLLNNLLVNNFYNDIGYSQNPVGTDEIEINFGTLDPNDIINVTNIQNTNAVPPIRVQITITSEGLNLIDFLEPLLLRSDYVVQNEGNNWNNVNFNIREYGGDINDWSSVTIEDIKEFNKLKISNNQQSQYLNLATLLEPLERDVEDYLTAESTSIPRYDVGGQAKFAYTDIIPKLNELQQFDDRTINIGLVLDGFRRDRDDNYTLPNILVNGDKKRVIDFFKIPFLNRDLTNVQIDTLDGNTFNLITGLNTLPKSSEQIISYVIIDRNDYSGYDRIKVNFRQSNQIKQSLIIEFDEKNCNYDVAQVSFVNSFGMLETTEMNGSIRQEFDYDSTDYQRPLRDINGNYNKNRHGNSVLNKFGEEELVLNTGIVREWMNSTYEDLIMSEKVWITIDGKTLPVLIDESNFNPKTRLIDTTVDYTFRFKVDNTVNKNIL